MRVLLRPEVDSTSDSNHEDQETYRDMRSPSLALLLAVVAQQAFAVDKTVNPTLDAELRDAPTQLDRLAKLDTDDAWLFDFTTKSPFYNFAPGGVVNMNAATFPAAVGNGMTCEFGLAW